jgi:hypothetical protein
VCLSSSESGRTASVSQRALAKIGRRPPSHVEAAAAAATVEKLAVENALGAPLQDAPEEVRLGGGGPHPY